MCTSTAQCEASDANSLCSQNTNVCVCIDGYSGGNGAACADIDECATSKSIYHLECFFFQLLVFHLILWLFFVPLLDLFLLNIKALI